MSEPTSELRVRATLLANSHSPALGSLPRHIHAEPHGTDHSCHQLVVDLPESGCDRSHNPAAFGSSRCLSAARGAAVRRSASGGAAQSVRKTLRNPRVNVPKDGSRANTGLPGAILCPSTSSGHAVGPHNSRRSSWASSQRLRTSATTPAPNAWAAAMTTVASLLQFSYAIGVRSAQVRSAAGISQSGATTAHLRACA